jgi:hypothetical protein
MQSKVPLLAISIKVYGLFLPILLKIAHGQKYPIQFRFMGQGAIWIEQVEVEELGAAPAAREQY